MKVVALFSAKGGVGKSSLAASLAHGAATRSGRRTLLWDLDPQGASGWLLGVEPKAGAKARKGLAAASLADLIQPSAFANLDVLAADRSLRRLEADLAGEDSEKRLKKALKQPTGVPQPGALRTQNNCTKVSDDGCFIHED